MKTEIWAGRPTPTAQARTGQQGVIPLSFFCSFFFYSWWVRAEDGQADFLHLLVDSNSTGAIRHMDGDSHPKAKTYRTRLGELVGSKADFAGHYKVLEVGAGTLATRVFLVDVDTGRVYLAPFIAGLGVKYSVESRLMLENDPQAVCDYARDFPGGRPDWLKTRPWCSNEGSRQLVFLHE